MWHNMLIGRVRISHVNNPRCQTPRITSQPDMSWQGQVGKSGLHTPVWPSICSLNTAESLTHPTNVMSCFLLLVDSSQLFAPILSGFGVFVTLAFQYFQSVVRFAGLTTRMYPSTYCIRQLISYLFGHLQFRPRCIVMQKQDTSCNVSSW